MTVSSSTDEPTCAFPGCGQSVVPGSAFCGDEDHSHLQDTAGDNAQDGSINPLNEIAGYNDGTGFRSDMSNRKTPETPAERRELSTSYSDQQSAVYAALCEFLSAGIGSVDDVDIWIVDLSPDWVVWESWSGAGYLLWRVEYSGTDADNITFTGVPEQVTISTTYAPVERSEQRSQEAESPSEADSGEDEEVAEDEVDEPEDRSSEPTEPTTAVEERAKRYKNRHRAIPDQRSEVRFSEMHFGISGAGIEMRSGSGDSTTVVLEGTPIVYNRAYDVHDMFGTFRETMAPTVCDGVLAYAGLDCRYLFNHDGLPLARTRSGTLELESRADGLYSRATVDLRQSLAKDLVVAIERGDVTQMSCGFLVADDEWDDDYMNRTIRRFADLLDVSPVTYPASPTTHVQVSQRMLAGVPVESRARIREAIRVANEIRAGKVLNKSNASLISSALAALHRADDVDITDIVTRLQDLDSAVDEGQAALAQVSGLPNPDGDAADKDPALVTDPGESIREDEADKELRDEEAAERRRRHLKAQRDKLARSRRPGV